MSILASFTRIPERSGSPAKITGIAAKEVERIAKQRVRRRKGRGFMGSNLILNRDVP
jgi:formate-dependent phosphoribosylglycinamide formyltransferase (GAR transformylase)